jgi:N-acetylmuramoyl-L-alanine amidase
MTLRQFSDFVCRCAVTPVIALSFMLTAPAVLGAQSITLTWDPNTEPNLAGYIVHSGTQSRSYSNQTDAGSQTSLPLTGLDLSKTYYFAVQAYSSDGLLSPLSQEAVLPPVVPAVPTTITQFTASAASPLLIGTPITWTANASSTAGPVEYKFMLFREQSGWSVAQEYSSARSFIWSPGWGDIGKAVVQVWVRAVGSTARYEAWTGTDLLDITASPARLSADTGFPSPPGQPITWTAAVASATAPLEYRFLVLDVATSIWSVAREYAAGNQLTWIPPHAGKFGLQVWVRRIGTTVPYETWAGSGEFEIKSSPLSVSAIEPDKAFPTLVGTAVTWTARTVGGSAGPLQFKFLRYSAQTGAWQLVQDYSTARTYSWTPTWGDEGSHVIQVWVRNAGSSATYDAWLGTGSFEIRAAALQLTSDAVFPVPPTANVRWKAEVADPSASLEYSFYVYNRGNGGWSLARPYNASNTFNWTPGSAGTYAFQVWARRSGSGAQYDLWRGTDFLDVFSSPARLKPLAVSSSFPVSVGTPITWTATASGGTTTALEYRFIIFNQTTGWRVLQEYSSNRSVTWTPTTQEAGTNALQVWVRSVGSASVYEDWQGTGFFNILR